MSSGLMVRGLRLLVVCQISERMKLSRESYVECIDVSRATDEASTDMSASLTRSYLPFDVYTSKCSCTYVFKMLTSFATEKSNVGFLAFHEGFRTAFAKEV